MARRETRQAVSSHAPRTPPMRSCACSTVPARGKARTADLVIVQDLRAYRRGHAHPGELSHIIGGGPIPVRVARELAKDAFLKVVLHDGVNIHTVVHFGRRRPAELNTALELGGPPDFDGVTCSEVGCDRKYGLQWDHIDPVANDGPTSVENLQPLCWPRPPRQDRTRPRRRAAQRQRQDEAERNAVHHEPAMCCR